MELPSEKKRTWTKEWFVSGLVGRHQKNWNEVRPKVGERRRSFVDSLLSACVPFPQRGAWGTTGWTPFCWVLLELTSWWKTSKQYRWEHKQEAGSPAARHQIVSGFRSHASSSSACSLMIPVVAPFNGTVEHRWRLWLMLPLHFWFMAFAHKPDHFPWCHHGKCFRLSITASSICRACGERSHQLFFCSFHCS